MAGLVPATHRLERVKTNFRASTSTIVSMGHRDKPGGDELVRASAVFF